MDEKRIKKMLKSRIKAEGLGLAVGVIIIGLILSLFGGPSMILLGIIVAIFFYIKSLIENYDEIKNVDHASLFYMYEDRNVLIKVMDEVINHPIIKLGATKVSKHFILYGDQYENIIRLYDVNAINITKLDDNFSQVEIKDRFNQKKKLKYVTKDAEKLYSYLSENCKNTVIGCPIEFEEGYQHTNVYHDEPLTEEYCFYEGESKKTVGRRTELRNNQNTKKEVRRSTKIRDVEQLKKEKQLENQQSEKKKNKKGSKNVNQKYNDLKKLKELLDNDILTKEEYDKEKSKILSD